MSEPIDFKKKIDDLLEKELTEKSYRMWVGISNKFPNIWGRSTSSTGKHHKRQDGTVPSVGEHTYEMLYAANKICRLFGTEDKSEYKDSILLAVSFHDSLKYGKEGNGKHTDKKHDQLIANVLDKNKEKIHQFLGEKNTSLLIEATRFHSGRWSADVDKTKPFDWSDYNPETLLVHILDMLSTADCLKFD